MLTTRFAQKIMVLLSRENKRVWSGFKLSNDKNKKRLGVNDKIKHRLGVDHQIIRKWIDENTTFERISEDSKKNICDALKNILGKRVDENIFNEDVYTRDFCALFDIDPCLCNKIIDTRIYADSALLPSFVYPEESLNRAFKDRIKNWKGLYRVYRYGLSPEYEDDIICLTLQVRYLIAPSKAFGRMPKNTKWRIRCRLNVPNIRNHDSPYRYDGFLHLGEQFADWIFESRTGQLDFIYMTTTATDDRSDNTGRYMSLTQGDNREPRCRPILVRCEEDIKLDKDPCKSYEQIAKFMKEAKHYNKNNPPPEDILSKLER